MTSSRASRGKLTYADHEQWPDDGKRHEIVDGVHHVSPAPFVDHQRLLTALLVQLHARIQEAGLGVVLPAPTDVLLSLHDVVQPDLVAVGTARTAIITARNIQGPPDLVIEIQSRSTRRLDAGVKKDLYARSGVPEYWIVDGEARRLEQHVRSASGYDAPVVCETRVESHAFPGVFVDLTRVCR